MLVYYNYSLPRILSSLRMFLRYKKMVYYFYWSYILWILMIQLLPAHSTFCLFRIFSCMFYSFPSFKSVLWNSLKSIIFFFSYLYYHYFLSSFPLILCFQCLISFLFLQGAVYSSPDYDGRTALHIAASEGHLEVVRFLLSHGALVHTRDRYGTMPLHDAVSFDQHEVIALLVQTGAHLKIHPYKLGIELCL